jgi:hypothetical protein
VALPREANDRVDDELAGTVVGDVPAAVDGDDVDAGRGERCSSSSTLASVARRPSV